MFGINGSEMIIILIVALVVIGPQRLPEYAAQLKEFVKVLKRRADEAKGNLKRDFGDDLPDVDWQSLDPRQYDPRRIVREALQEESEAARGTTGTALGSTAAGAVAAGGLSTAGAPAAAAAGAAASGAAGASAAGSAAGGTATAVLSPMERYQSQRAKRVAAQAPPFDIEAT